VDRGLAARQLALLVIGLVGLLGCLLVFGLLAEDVRAQEASALDALATPFLHSLASPTLDALMNFATFLGSDLTILPILVVVTAYLIWKGHRREAVFLLVALGGSVLANATMKLFFHRARPALPWAIVLPDFSFPSGHSMNSMVFYVGLALVVWRLRGARWGVAATVVAVVLAILIGISRIYLGYHYLTDVVGGFAAGLLWLAFVIAVFRGHALLFGRPRRGRGHPPRPT
jgi:undecaprenyl-diphosphatase